VWLCGSPGPARAGSAAGPDRGSVGGGRWRRPGDRPSGDRAVQHAATGGRSAQSDRRWMGCGRSAGCGRAGRGGGRGASGRCSAAGGRARRFDQDPPGVLGPVSVEGGRGPRSPSTHRPATAPTTARDQPQDAASATSPATSPPWRAPASPPGTHHPYRSARPTQADRLPARVSTHPAPASTGTRESTNGTPTHTTPAPTHPPARDQPRTRGDQPPHTRPTDIEDALGGRSPRTATINHPTGADTKPAHTTNPHP